MLSFKLIPDDTNIDFMKYAKLGTILSAAAVVASIVLFFAVGLNFGIDFKGGTLIEVRMTQNVDIKDLRSKISGLGLGNVEIQEFGVKTDASIRFETQPGGEKAQQNGIKKVKEVLGTSVKEYMKVDVVGPKVSGELALEGTIAVIVAILAVMIYIWFRFEWQFAIGAVLSLSHDVALTIGVFSILQLDFGLSIVAAILTIVGYSLNDTVVVYDRIRENLRKFKKRSLREVINQSLNQMLRRTLITSIYNLLALSALYIFGGPVLSGFTFTMIWGVIIGTYSSIFIAAPLLIYTGAKIADSVRDDGKNSDTADEFV